MKPTIGSYIQVFGIISMVRENGKPGLTMCGEADGEVTSIPRPGFYIFRNPHFGLLLVHETAIELVTTDVEPPLGPTWEEGKPLDSLL